MRRKHDRLLRTVGLGVVPEKDGRKLEACLSSSMKSTFSLQLILNDLSDLQQNLRTLLIIVDLFVCFFGETIKNFFKERVKRA